MLNDKFEPSVDEFELLMFEHPYLQDYFKIEELTDRTELYNRWYPEVFNYFYKTDDTNLIMKDKMCFYNLLAHLIWYHTTGTRTIKPNITSGNLKGASVGDVSTTYDISKAQELRNFFNLTPFGQFYLICLKQRKGSTVSYARLVKGATTI